MDWQMRLGLGLGDDEKHGFTWDRDKEVLRLLRWIRVHQLHSCSRHDVMWQNSVWKVPAAPEMPPQTKFGATVCNIQIREISCKCL